jgi:transcription termination factor Rho
MDPNVLARKQLPELRTMAAELRMRGYQRLRKADLIEAIVKEANRQADPNRRSELANGSGPDRGDESGGEPVVASDNGEQLQLDRDDPVADDGGDSDGDGDGDGDQGDDGDDGQRRRRRSRRERRRNRGTGDDGRSQQPSRDDEQGAETGESRTGVLDVLPEGYGFLRTTGYLPGDRDAYVSQSTIRKIGLRRGDIVSGPIRQHKSSDKVPALAFVHTVNGIDLSDGARMPSRPDFKDMTPLFPDERLHLETQGGPISMRIVDLMSPIGKGQRGLIVSPPKAGKTTILKELGQAIVANNPECHLMVVLVDERPEEVTDMQRSVKG